MKFLIVEDDPVSSQLLEVYISDYGQCTVVADGRSAAKAFEDSLNQNQPYDLVCLDIMLPEMDGHGTLKAIRQMEKEQQINDSDKTKVIMMTALDNIRHINKAFEEGCEAYLVKPIKKEELLKKMKKFDIITSPVNN